ncbi:hypothetical protein VNO78_03266 [Psophocarpus tetragonolobus]|uniref:RNase H type-1 domain-containing protein n=1 Tax=Psophocarpus tetragonolobus TaxID=3891 RepID=A0AAN9XWS8_PSOTE
MAPSATPMIGPNIDDVDLNVRFFRKLLVKVMKELPEWCGDPLQLIKGQTTSLHPYVTLFHKIRTLLALDWEVNIQHIFSEGNACANVIAKDDAQSNISNEVVHACSDKFVNTLIVAF